MCLHIIHYLPFRCSVMFIQGNAFSFNVYHYLPELFSRDLRGCHKQDKSREESQSGILRPAGDNGLWLKYLLGVIPWSLPNHPNVQRTRFAVFLSFDLKKYFKVLVTALLCFLRTVACIKNWDVVSN